MGPLRCEWQPAAVDKLLAILLQTIYHPLRVQTYAHLRAHAYTNMYTHAVIGVCVKGKAGHTCKQTVERIITRIERFTLESLVYEHFSI